MLFCFVYKSVYGTVFLSAFEIVEYFRVKKNPTHKIMHIIRAIQMRIGDITLIFHPSFISLTSLFIIQNED